MGEWHRRRWRKERKQERLQGQQNWYGDQDKETSGSKGKGNSETRRTERRNLTTGVHRSEKEGNVYVLDLFVKMPPGAAAPIKYKPMEVDAINQVADGTKQKQTSFGVSCVLWVVLCCVALCCVVLSLYVCVCVCMCVRVCVCSV